MTVCFERGEGEEERERERGGGERERERERGREGRERRNKLCMFIRYDNTIIGNDQMSTTDLR